jgi:tetratricopeptide (TPR) repeat protein
VASSPAPAQVLSIRYRSKPEGTTVAVFLSAPAPWKSGVLSAPERIYFDLENTRLPAQMLAQSNDGATIPVNDALVKQIRASLKQPNAVRVVLDLAAARTQHSAVLLRAEPWQLLIELRHQGARNSAPADLSPLALRTDPSAWTTLQLEPGKPPPLALGNLAQKSAWAAWLRAARDLLLGWTEGLPRSRESGARMSAVWPATSAALWSLPGLTLPVCNGPFVGAGDLVPTGADAASPLIPDDDADPPPSQATAQRFSGPDPWTALPHPCSSPGAMPLASPGANAPATVSVTELRAPKDARKAYEKAQHALQKRKLAEAQMELEQAVRVYPHYAAAWADLGWLYAQQNRLDPARHAFAQARSADQNFVPAYLGLAALAMHESKWPEVVELSARATRLDGADFPAAFYFNSLGNFQLGKLDNAEGSARQAEGLDPHHAWPQVSLLLGVILAQKQDYSGATAEFKSYLKSAPNAANADKVRHQLAELEKLTASEPNAAGAPPSR